MTEPQRALFVYWRDHVWWTVEQWQRWLRTSYRVTSISRLTDAQATEALARLRTKIEG